MPCTRAPGRGREVLPYQTMLLQAKLAAGCGCSLFGKAEHWPPCMRTTYTMAWFAVQMLADAAAALDRLHLIYFQLALP